MDLVSVIIPYFKKKKFVDQSISSALNQSYSNIEIMKNQLKQILLFLCVTDFQLLSNGEDWEGNL